MNKTDPHSDIIFCNFQYEMPLAQIKDNKMDKDSKALMGSIVLGFLIVAIIYIAYKLLT